MRALGTFVMKGRTTAALVVACFAVLALLFPPLLLLSGGALALVTLRAGIREGLLVMVLGTLGGMALAWPAIGHPQPILVFAVPLWLPVWAIASVLRATVSMGLALRILAALSSIPVIVIFAILGDPAQWWTRVINEVAPILVQEQGGGGYEQMFFEYAGLLAPKLTGIIVSQGVAFIALSLIIGRWWQGVLYNPGGFGTEFRDLRMGQPFAIAVLGLFGLALFAGMDLLSNIVLAVSVVIGLFGLAVIHGAVFRAKAGRGWLVCVYVLMFPLLYHVLAFLSLLGAADTWFDLRSKIAARTGGS